MSAPAKYLFDTKLDGPEAPPPIAVHEVEDMKTAHALELAHIKQQSYEQGRLEGQRDAEQSLESDLLNKLEQLVEESQILQTEIDEKLQAARASSALLAMTIAKKLARSLLTKYPHQHIEQFFEDALALLPNKTSLRLHVAPDLAPALQPRLQELLERNGHENTLQTIEDQTIEGVNCRLTWLDGGLEQDTDQIISHIEEMIENGLYAETRTPENTPANELAGQAI